MRNELKDAENIEPVVQKVNKAIIEADYTNCQEKSRRQNFKMI